MNTQKGTWGTLITIGTAAIHRACHRKSTSFRLRRIAKLLLATGVLAGSPAGTSTGCALGRCRTSGSGGLIACRCSLSTGRERAFASVVSSLSLRSHDGQTLWIHMHGMAQVQYSPESTGCGKHHHGLCSLPLRMKMRLVVRRKEKCVCVRNW